MSETSEKQTKRYLKRYKKNLACIRRLEEKLIELNGWIEKIRSSNLSGMPRGGIPVSLDDLLSDKEDLIKRIDRLKAKSRNLKNAVYDMIDSLDDERYCSILEGYYIECLSIEEVAEKEGYTPRYIYDLYKEAILALTIEVQK